MALKGAISYRNSFPQTGADLAQVIAVGEELERVPKEIIQTLDDSMPK